MKSWGESWGSAWGSAWGSVSDGAVEGSSGAGKKRKYPRITYIPEEPEPVEVVSAPVVIRRIPKPKVIAKPIVIDEVPLLLPELPKYTLKLPKRRQEDEALMIALLLLH